MTHFKYDTKKRYFLKLNKDAPTKICHSKM